MTRELDGAASVAAEGGQDVQERAHARAYLSLAILMVLNILSWIDRQIIVLLVDPIKRDLLISDFQISLLQGLAFALCYCLASVPLAWLADRYSRRLVMFYGVLVWTLATTASGLAVSFEQLFAARFLVGIGEAALAPAAFSMLAELFPRRRLALATGLLASSSAIGSAVAIFAGGLLYSWAEQTGAVSLPWGTVLRPWQLVFILVGLPAIPLAFTIFAIPESRRDRAQSLARSEAGRGFLHWLARHWLFVFGISIGVSSLGVIAYGVSNWTPAFLSRTMGLDIGEIGVKLGTVQMAAGICGFIGSGLVIDALTGRGVSNAGYRYLMFIAAALLVIGPVTFFLIRSETWLLALIGLFHLILPYNGVVVAHLNQATPAAYRARMIAIVTTVITLIGMIVGPSAVALLTDYAFGDPTKLGLSLGWVFLICAPLALVLLALSFRASRVALDAAVRQELQ